MMDRLVIVIIILTAAALLGSLTYAAYWNATHTCSAGHNITYWYQPDPAQAQGRYEETEYVCDEWREK